MASGVQLGALDPDISTSEEDSDYEPPSLELGLPLFALPIGGDPLSHFYGSRAYEEAEARGPDEDDSVERKCALRKRREADEAELLGALDWLDVREGFSSRGMAGVSGAQLLKQRRPNAGGGALNKQVGGTGSSLQPRANQHQKYSGQICTGPLEEWEGSATVNMSNSVTTTVRDTVRRQAQGVVRVHEKADRATHDQVLDPRTGMILHKMFNAGHINKIHGCVSTGKEASVFHATDPSGNELAVKIYKTSILVFRDRARYVDGDKRFRNTSRHNPRKMVRTWAEKEMRNLLRGQKQWHGKLVVDLFYECVKWGRAGNQGWAAPKLKDAVLTNSKLYECYFELVLTMRTMYQTCRLVHADLSEYNLLYFEGHICMIDVSQSVELDHPLALDFLREDCLHVTNFFKKAGIAAISVRELFDFVRNQSIEEHQVEAYLEQVLAGVQDKSDEAAAEEAVNEAVFVQSFIPRNLEQVIDYERDCDMITSGQAPEGIYYETINNLLSRRAGDDSRVDDEQSPETQLHRSFEVGADDADTKVDGAASENSDEESDSSTSSVNGDVEDSEDLGPGQKLSKEDVRQARKEHKKQVKADKREARKKKVPKALKQKNKRIAAAKKGKR